MNLILTTNQTPSLMLTLHIPGSCPCRACTVATTPAGAANIADWNGYAAGFPAVDLATAPVLPLVFAADRDPFTPTAAELAAEGASALGLSDAELDLLFDTVGYDPFAEDAMPLFTDGEWAICPVHGFHDAADNGEPLSFCEKCEER